jgi:hypothetical protein
VTIRMWPSWQLVSRADARDSVDGRTRWVPYRTTGVRVSMAKRIYHVNDLVVLLEPAQEYEREHRAELHALSRQLHFDIIADV